VTRTPEVCVVGGGPAGLAAAIALTMRGFETTVLERAAPPVDKACGEGLMPDGMEALRSLGIALAPPCGHPFRGIAFVGSGREARADFPLGTGFGLRRTTLHSLLIERARELQIPILWQSRGVRLEGGDVLADGERWRPKWIVAADGQKSSVRDAAGLGRTRREQTRFGFRRRYRTAPWSRYVELHWGDGFQLYVTPVGADEVSVALLAKRPGLRLDEALQDCPRVSERLQGATVSTPEAGGISAFRRLAAVQRGNVFLVGDASGSVDAITGEGISLAFRQALTLAELLEAGESRAYQPAHDGILRRARLMSHLLLLLDTQPSSRRRALAALERHPALFSAMLALHVGQSAAGRLLSRELFQFCCVFLRA
jgi:menaquinone-9 beta-reductase